MKRKYLALGLLSIVLLTACTDKTTEVEKVEEDIEIVTDLPKEKLDDDSDINEASWFYDMKTKDFDGNEIDITMFQEYDLTLINVWATWCAPCIIEIPELEEVSKEFTNVGVKGLIAQHDDYGNLMYGITDENRDNVEDILKNANATYQHIISWEGLLDTGYKNIMGYPTTVFVDSEGNFVGEPVKGGKTKEKWAEIINTRLEMVKNEE